MKFKIHILLSVLLMLGSVNTFAQIGIGTTTPAPSAALEVSSIGNNKGVLIPRLTATQKDAIASPAEGLLVYQTTAPIGFYFYTNTVWKLIVTQTELDKKSTETETQSLLNLKENTANKSTDVSLTDASNVKFPTELAVKTYVTGQITAENAARASAIAGVQAALQSNTNTTNTAIELKENTANKSTDVSLADASNVKFPTELAVKTYVTGQITAENTARATAIAGVQAALQSNVNTLSATVASTTNTTNAAIDLKENVANKSTDVSLADSSNVKFPTELAVKTYVTGQITAENTARATAIAGVQAALQSNVNTLSATVASTTNTT
ncbi:hypothetical protein, partial [Daejeonella sp.]|uniref:hypothetical protein n=1 Tax=Daejeonella sp. TaxID=2805397 RepID=UPI00378487B3